MPRFAKTKRASKRPAQWQAQAARLMVLRGCSFQHAVSELEIDLTRDEAEALEKHPDFLEILWQERHKFYQDIGNDPHRNKAALLGRQEVLIQKLIEHGEYKKAAEANMELARLEGYLKNEQQDINILNLTQKDLDEIKAKLSDDKDPVNKGPRVKETEHLLN